MFYSPLIVSIQFLITLLDAKVISLDLSARFLLASISIINFHVHCEKNLNHMISRNDH